MQRKSIDVFRKDSGGKTAYEKSFGRRWTRPSLEYGELVYIREAKEKSGRLDWEQINVPVRFVGPHARTNSVMGLSSEGLKMGQAVKRLSYDRRWSKEPASSALELQLRSPHWLDDLQQGHFYGSLQLEEVELMQIPSQPPTPAHCDFDVEFDDDQILE
eukprot:s324_g18.t1